MLVVKIFYNSPLINIGKSSKCVLPIRMNTVSKGIFTLTKNTALFFAKMSATVVKASLTLAPRAAWQ
jgi:hypothetical protein